LAANGVTVWVGSRDLGRGETAAAAIRPGAIAIQLDVTHQASITAAAARIGKHFGRLELLVNNAAISNTRKGDLSLKEYAKISTASLKEVCAIWETNVFPIGHINGIKNYRYLYTRA
jgi:NAD(P)-dependent dehydrogenase (short-subunit alcohol dehydrogenase family)